MPLALVLAVLAQAPKSLAMPPWAATDVKPELVAFYGDHLAKELRAEGFTVITATEIAALLSAERQKQLLGCADDSSSCLEELANALGADATVLVRLLKLGDSFRAQVKVVRSTDSAVLAETQLEAATEAQLLEELGGAARRIARDLRPKGRPKLPFVTGALGVVGLATGAGLLLAATNQYRVLEARLDSVMAASDPMNTSVARLGEGLQTGGWLLFGIGVAAVVATVVLLVLGVGP